MRALLVFKKPGQEEGTTLYRFERRDMGCFNGLNTTNAFTPRLLKSNSLNNNVAIIEKHDRNVRLIQRTEDETRDWEFMALGWMTDFYTDAAAARRGNLPIDYAASHISCSETFSHQNSLRRLTPNEAELKALVGRIEALEFAFVADHNNLIFTVLRLNREFNNHMAVDFVGSERNTGMAVAYLQVFRNTSRNMSDSGGSQHTYTAQLRMAYRIGLIDHNGNSKLRYPGIIMSNMFNHGSDSDIFSFAGPVVHNQAKVHGLFSLEQFFRDTRPMVEEGRYNKGGQSDTLEANVAARYRELFGQYYRASEVNPVESILSGVRSLTSLNDYFSVSYISAHGTSRALEQTTQLMSSNNVQNLQRNILRLAEMPSGWHDIRTPSRQNVQREAVASTIAGFTQWLSNNDTIETE